MRRTKRGVVGIGTLIILIASIMVAAITATVLLRTSTLLQAKALEVGSQAQQRVTNLMSIVSIKATDGSDGAIENIEIIMKTPGGAEAIRLDECFFEVNTPNFTTRVTYGGVGSTGYFTNSTTGRGNFTVVYLKQADNHIDGVLLDNEMVKIYFSLGTNVSHEQDMSMTSITKNGMAQVWDFSTPLLVNDKRVALFPG